MLSPEFGTVPAGGAGNDFSALVVTADPVFGARLAGGLVRAGAGLVRVVRSAVETRHTARSEVRDLVLVDLGLPKEAATGLIAELRRCDWQNIVAVVPAGAGHLTDAAVLNGAHSLLVKFAEDSAAGRRCRGTPGDVLSAQELRALVLVADGCTDAMIGGKLGLTADQAKAMVRRIRLKLSARDRAHLVSKALRAGIIE